MRRDARREAPPARHPARDSIRADAPAGLWRVAGRYRRAAAGLAGALALTGCGGYMAREARTRLPGTTLPDLIACAGVPDHRMRVDRLEWVLVYDQSSAVQPSLTASVSALASLVKPAVTMGAAGTCRAIVRIYGNRVRSVHYAGPSGTFEGPNAACAPLVRDCLSHPDRTVLPADYDAGAVLGEAR